MADGGIHDQVGGGFCRYSVETLGDSALREDAAATTPSCCRCGRVMPRVPARMATAQSRRNARMADSRIVAPTNGRIGRRFLHRARRGVRSTKKESSTSGNALKSARCSATANSTLQTIFWLRSRAEFRTDGMESIVAAADRTGRRSARNHSRRSPRTSRQARAGSCSPPARASARAPDKILTLMQRVDDWRRCAAPSITLTPRL